MQTLVPGTLPELEGPMAEGKEARREDLLRGEGHLVYRPPER